MSKIVENYLLTTKNYLTDEIKNMNISDDIYILCNRTKNIIDSEFFNVTISEELLQKITNYLIIYKTSNVILNNNIHNKN